MSTRSSFVRAALLACAIAPAGGVVLGCADKEEAGLLDPAATLTPSSRSDLPADFSTTKETAYVAPGSANDLIGAVVNDDGSITKGDVNIGSVAAARPVLSTSRTGVSRADDGFASPGNGSGSGGVVLDKEAPRFNPNGPQHDVECMVRIWYYTDTGEIIRVEILFCWDDENGNGGGGNNNRNQQQQVTFRLSCDASVTRGTYGSCIVDASTEDGEIDTDEFTFSWSSSTGASDSGVGMDSWGGTVTETATITVSIGGQSESKTVLATSRSGWVFQSLSEQPTYTSLSSGGRYTITSRSPSSGSGSGPWAGRRYVVRPPSVTGKMEIHHNYASNGPDYPGANTACANAAGLRPDDNYWNVNRACGTFSAYTAWRDFLIRHERQHERGYSNCMTGGTGRRLMADLEGLAMDASSNEMSQLWDRFWSRELLPAGEWASSGTSGTFHIYFGGSPPWGAGTVSTPGHSGNHGC